MTSAKARIHDSQGGKPKKLSRRERRAMRDRDVTRADLEAMHLAIERWVIEHGGDELEVSDAEFLTRSRTHPFVRVSVFDRYEAAREAERVSKSSRAAKLTQKLLSGIFSRRPDSPGYTIELMRKHIGYRVIEVRSCERDASGEFPIVWSARG